MVVENKDGQVVLDQPFVTIVAGESGSLQRQTTSAEEVQERYGRLIDAFPERSEKYTLYFISGSSEQLTPESIRLLDVIKKTVLRRAAPEVSVVGHTDRVGNLEKNDELALRRAQYVRQIILRYGIGNKDIVTASGRGEREPTMVTADDVDEPLNRRVTIEIR